ncbi:MAG: hypothetical protein KGI97_03860, partial [Alphaproteobacteria bacterium]|nr:hypothetical protein [Alphaproteobacteria bacterium]
VAEQDSLNSKTRNRTIGTLIGLAISPIFIGSIFLPYYLQKKQCPISTFHCGTMPSAGADLPFSVLGIGFSLLVFASLVVSRHLTRKAYNFPILISLLGLLVSTSFYINSVDYYFCVTPANIIVREGYFSAAHSYTWNEITDVSAWCWISHTRGQPSYHGGTLKLTFNDGKSIPFGLSNGRRFLLNDYEMLRQSLQHETYRYHTNSTVNPSLCPAELYHLLHNWIAQ